MKFSPTAILLRRQWRDNDSPLLKAFPEILRALIGKLKHLIPTLNGPAVWCTVGVCASRSSNYRISTSWTSWISASKGISTLKQNSVAFKLMTTEAKTMRSLRFHKTSSLDDLRVEEVPIPTPSEDEVLVQVKAAAINPSDVKN